MATILRNARKPRLLGALRAFQARRKSTAEMYIPSTAPAAPLPTTFPIRNDWTREEVGAIYASPLLELVHVAGVAHRQYFNGREVQQCQLLSIKTGGCSEDCAYCSQSSKHKNTRVPAQRLMDVDAVVSAATAARDGGATRFCMGAAWRGVSQVGPRQFQRVCDMIRQVRGLGLEVCATLGTVNEMQAKKLKEAGLTAYNHNLDTSREHYPRVITSRTYDERLSTLRAVRSAGLSVCCGGILGLGEQHEDRVALLTELGTMRKHPESVPVNALVANKGTPLEDMAPVPVWDLARMIATARIVMPRSMVRLSAGRISLGEVDQALCFLAGANSIFMGDKLLTTPNNDSGADGRLFETLGLSGKKPFFYETEYAKEHAAASVHDSAA